MQSNMKAGVAAIVRPAAATLRSSAAQPGSHMCSPSAVAARSTLSCHALMRSACGSMMPPALQLRGFSSSAAGANMEGLPDAMQRMLSLDNASQVRVVLPVAFRRRKAVFAAVLAVAFRRRAGCRFSPCCAACRDRQQKNCYMPAICSVGPCRYLQCPPVALPSADGKEQTRNATDYSAVSAPPLGHGFQRGPNCHPF